jgi:hypothetical protein
MILFQIYLKCFWLSLCDHFYLQPKYEFMFGIFFKAQSTFLYSELCIQ